MPTLIEQQIEEFENDERFRPIQFCHVGENKMQYVKYVRDDIKSFLKSSMLLAQEDERKRWVEKAEGLKGINRLTKDEALDILIKKAECFCGLCGRCNPVSTGIPGSSSIPLSKL